MSALAGKRVLLAASAHTAQRLATVLERLGAHVEARPTIELTGPTDPEPARAALRELVRYDWIVFTSANGVRAFVALRAESADAAPVARARVAAVGPGTAAALAAAGLEAELVARRSDAQGLLDELLSRAAAGERVLLVRPEMDEPELARSLRDRGLAVDAVAFYRNVPAAGAGDAARALLERDFDAVVFTSPSSFARLRDALRDALPEEREALDRGLTATRRVALGPVTAAALASAGLPADAVCSEPTGECLADTLVAAFR